MQTQWFGLAESRSETQKTCFFYVSFTNRNKAFYSVCLCHRSEAPPAEHRLWQLPGKRGVPSHRVRHRRQAEGEDGCGVSPHEEPVVRAAGQLHGLHHVSKSLLF